MNWGLKVLMIVALSGCEGKVTSEKISLNEVNALNSTSSSSSVISVGSITNGTNLDIQLSDNDSTDEFQMYDSAKILSALKSALGESVFSHIQMINQDYLDSLAIDKTTLVPKALFPLVYVSFQSRAGKISTLTIPLIKLLAPNAMVITRGSFAHYGIGMIPAGSGVLNIVLSSLSSASYIKVGSALALMGGVSGAIANRAVVTVTFDSGTFTINRSPSSFAEINGVVRIVPKLVNLGMIEALGLSTSFVGHHVLVAYVNPSNKIILLSLLNLSTGVITVSPTACSAVTDFFPDLNCNLMSNGAGVTTAARI